MISPILFFLLISSGSFYMTAFCGRKYEETVPLTIFSAVEIVFLFGLIDNLKLGAWVVCAFAVVLYALGAYRTFKDKSFKTVYENTFTPAFYIFLIALTVYAFYIYGRTAWMGDEFSFWAISVKKMWYLNALPCVPEAEPYFTQYPPGMQILGYLLQFFGGAFSEWKINFAYMAFALSLFLPFLKNLKLSNFFTFLLVGGVAFSAGTIIYPDCFDNLQVDFVLGATFAYGLASVFTLKKTARRDCFALARIVMTANMLILIKSAGKLFAALVMLALLLVLVWELKKDKIGVSRLLSGWKRALGAAAGAMLPAISAYLWKLKYTHYGLPLTIDEGNYDVLELIRVLFGGGEGTNVEIRNRFYYFLLSERIKIGIFSMTNVVLFGLLVCVCTILLYLYGGKENARAQKIAVAVLLVGTVVYWIGLLASYLFVFSKYEGLALASMQRYLNIYFVGLVFFCIFLIFRRISEGKWNCVISCCVLLAILSCTSYQSVAQLLSRKTVDFSNEQRAPFQALADQIYADSAPDADEEKETVLFINRDGYPHGPVNHFTYLLWPDYKVPWECSYGTMLFDGDRYTKNLTPTELKQHTVDLSVDYIAIYYLDDYFINTYKDLFDHPLMNGQVYKVDDNAPQFELLQIQEG